MPASASRARFLLLGAAGVLSACGEKREPPIAAPRRAGGDLALLRSTLALEHVEVALYEQARASSAIAGRTRALAEGFGATEAEHLERLEATVRRLGGRPPRAPRAAFGPLTEERFLEVAGTLENLAAAAYLGLVVRVRDDELLADALAIHSVEGRHAATWNVLAGRRFEGGRSLEGSIPDGAFATPFSPEQVRAQLEPYLAA